MHRKGIPPKTQNWEAMVHKAALPHQIIIHRLHLTLVHYLPLDRRAVIMPSALKDLRLGRSHTRHLLTTQEIPLDEVVCLREVDLLLNRERAPKAPLHQHLPEVEHQSEEVLTSQI